MLWDCVVEFITMGNEFYDGHAMPIEASENFLSLYIHYRISYLIVYENQEKN